MSKKIVGIIGGMGPMSTVNFMKHVIELTPAKTEQDNIRMLVDNRPQIPDRTKAIIENGPSPVNHLIDSAKLLENAGADFIVMICNTVYFFANQIQREISIPILSLPENLSEYINLNFPEKSEIILLATTGTIKTNLYSKHLRKLKILIPDSASQKDEIMDAIYGPNGIKSNHSVEYARNKLLRAIDKIRTDKTKAIIAGCTEISLALENYDLKIPILNPLKLLAKKVVEIAF